MVAAIFGRPAVLFASALAASIPQLSWAQARGSQFTEVAPLKDSPGLVYSLDSPARARQQDFIPVLDSGKGEMLLVSAKGVLRVRPPKGLRLLRGMGDGDGMARDPSFLASMADGTVELLEINARTGSLASRTTVPTPPGLALTVLLTKGTAQILSAQAGIIRLLGPPPKHRRWPVPEGVMALVATHSKGRLFVGGFTGFGGPLSDMLCWAAELLESGAVAPVKCPGAAIAGLAFVNERLILGWVRLTSTGSVTEIGALDESAREFRMIGELATGKESRPATFVANAGRLRFSTRTSSRTLITIVRDGVVTVAELSGNSLRRLGRLPDGDYGDAAPSCDSTDGQCIVLGLQDVRVSGRWVAVMRRFVVP